MERPEAVGKLYEALFDLSLKDYSRQRKLIGVVNYPEIKIIRYPKAIVVGKAASDRSITLVGGLACHVDIKSFKHKAVHTYSFVSNNPATNKGRQRRRAQYNWMMEAAEFTPLVFYAACWRWNDVEDWVFHPVRDVERTETGLVFYKDKGIPIPSHSGVPDWLGLVWQYYKQVTL